MAKQIFLIANSIYDKCFRGKNSFLNLIRNKYGAEGETLHFNTEI